MNKKKLIISIFLVLNLTNIYAIKKNNLKQKSETQTQKELSINSNFTGIKDIGEKPIIIGIHGVADTADWIENRFDKDKYTIIRYDWNQDSITRGSRDGEVINAAYNLAILIINIHLDLQNKKINNIPITIIAHSFGGIVTKVFSNLINKKYRKFENETAPYEIVDTRYEEKSSFWDRIKNIFTKNIYLDTYKKIQNQIIQYNIDKFIPITVYTLGTPNRNEYPFIEDMDIIKILYNIYSLGDEPQRRIGYSRIATAKNFSPENNKFNIEAQIIKDRKIILPDHNQLIRNTFIIEKLFEINKETIKENLELFLNNFKNEKNKIIEEKTHETIKKYL